MSEITIVCLADSVSLYDIGVFLFRGDRAKVKAHLAQGSKDFQDAKGRGMLAVVPQKVGTLRSPQEAEAENRVEISRPAIEPRMPGVRGSFTPPVRVVNPEPVQVNLSGLETRLDALMVEVRAIRQEMNRVPIAAPAVQLPSQPVVSRPKELPVEESPVPVFIPSNLVQSSNGRVDVQADAGKNTSALDAASAILKAKKRVT